MTLAVLATCGTPRAHADATADLFAQYKTASGGAHWDTVKSLRSTGTLAAGGLSGAIEAIQDVSSGRSTDRYKLGPVEGADGYDGKLAWQRDPGGEVAALDAPEARQHARSQAWLDARGFWYPTRIAATYGKVELRELDHKRYAVVVATPDGGDAITLWFDSDTHLLVRTAQAQGGDTTTTTFDDWRDVDGLHLPFHMTSDVTDSAGRTDARARTEMRIDRVTLDSAIADADFAMPQMAVTARIDAPDGVARIPFDLYSNHIYVDGSIDGKKARFLVDTGGANMLTPAAAKKFDLTGEGKLAARGVGDEMVDMAMAHAKEVRIGAAVLAKPVFFVVDLGEMPKVEGVDSDGLVGYEMFRRFGVTIDYAKHELVLVDPARFVPPAHATALPFELAERIPIVNGVLDGVPARISIDTGSRVSLTLHSPYARKHDLVAKYAAGSDAVIGWGLGGASRGRPARFGTLQLADLSIPGIAGDIYTGDKGAFASTDISANLGGGVLRRFTVAFDYTAKRMYLAPNASFDAPDVFDRSGLWLLGEGDALKIADVGRSSAAERAGLRADDRIVAMGDEAVAKHGLAEWRQRLRELPVGTKLAVRYLRGDKENTTELVLADRIAPVWKKPGAAR
jgi:hypothetical protein